MQTPGVVRWIRSRGAALVTVSTQTQKDAISLLLEEKIRQKYTADELARLIRPTIGLYRQQTAAVERYYDKMVQSLTKDHPRTKPQVIRQRALTQATKYAERLHRQRAITIAQTEMAFAYNFGADEGIRQAQADFLIGKVEKRWCTSGDDRVCPECSALDGRQIGMDELFFSGNRVEYDESGLYPPLHPRCACAVQYVEVEAPRFANYSEERARLTTNNNNNVPVRVVDAPGYIEKFDNLTSIPEVNSKIYSSAVEILKHRNGTNQEDLYLIDGNTGDTIFKLTSSTMIGGVQYNKDIEEAIEAAHRDGRSIIAIHNHPNGLPPTLDDGSSAFAHGYDAGVVVGHNLEVWTFKPTPKHYSKEACAAFHQSMAEGLQFEFEIDDSIWYNALNDMGMEVHRQ